MWAVEYSDVISDKVNVRYKLDLHNCAAVDSHLLGGDSVLLYLSLINHIFPARQVTEFAYDRM